MPRGGSEGPRKLQGYKALDEGHRRSRAVEMAAELRSFLQIEKQTTCPELWEAARKRAEQLLAVLSKDAPAASAESEGVKANGTQ